MYYRAIKTVFEDRISYGITLFSEDKELMRIEDITDSFEAITEMVSEFNKEELDPIHFEEVIEYFLADLSFN